MRYFLSLAFISLITSCVSNETADSKDVNQSEIYQIYRISWLDGDEAVRASFRFGGENGTTLRLSKPSGVTYNGKQLAEGKFLLGGAFYNAEVKTYPSKHIFRFTDADGKIYENSYQFEAIEFENAPKTVGNDENLVIKLSRKIANEESINFRAQSDTLNFAEAFIGTSPNDPVYYDDKEQQLIIKPSFFVEFTYVSEPAIIWMEKNEVKKSLDQPTNLSGEFHFNYKTKEIRVKRVAEKL